MPLIAGRAATLPPERGSPDQRQSVRPRFGDDQAEPGAPECQPPSTGDDGRRRCHTDPMPSPAATGIIILVTGVAVIREGMNRAGSGLQAFARAIDGTLGFCRSGLQPIYRYRRRTGRNPVGDRVNL
jgi:hypothetical protein